MKIRDIKTFPTHIGRNLLIVKVETDEDIYGWGESDLSSRERAVEGATLHFCGFLASKDPMNEERASHTEFQITHTSHLRRRDGSIINS